MALKNYNPTTPSLRGTVLIDAQTRDVVLTRGGDGLMLMTRDVVRPAAVGVTEVPMVSIPGVVVALPMLIAVSVPVDPPDERPVIVKLSIVAVVAVVEPDATPMPAK